VRSTRSQILALAGTTALVLALPGIAGAQQAQQSRLAAKAEAVAKQRASSRRLPMSPLGRPRAA
jgi:hypothetical protein